MMWVKLNNQTNKRGSKMQVFLGIDTKGQYDNIYCSKNCAEESSSYDYEVMTDSEIMEDEQTCLCDGDYHVSDLGLWYSQEEDVISPNFGMCCSHCEEYIGYC